MPAIWGEHSKLAIVTKDGFTNDHSLAPKNSGLVYWEGKGEAALLQNTLLRWLIMPDGLHQFHYKTVPLWHFRRNMAGMTQDMALVEFATVHFLRNGWHFFKKFIFLHVKCFTFKSEYNVMRWVPHSDFVKSLQVECRVDPLWVINDGPTLPHAYENLGCLLSQHKAGRPQKLLGVYKKFLEVLMSF